MKLLIIIFVVILSSCATPHTDLTKSKRLISKEAIPLKVVEPRFPMQAAINSISGYVRFLFDVSPAGAVENLRIVESVPEGMFDAAATYAISRWTFKPAVKNGHPVKQTDMVYTLEFKIGE
ncbi:energy transducer TonB [Aliikangiella maris]|uniref:Energy transducer TonB n=2 Tax=Aliikangiella maris TaxID=3162458 RepID=A0ABV2BVG8_9GAMM